MPIWLVAVSKLDPDEQLVGTAARCVEESTATPPGVPAPTPGMVALVPPARSVRTTAGAAQLAAKSPNAVTPVRVALSAAKAATGTWRPAGVGASSSGPNVPACTFDVNTRQLSVAGAPGS